MKVYLLYECYYNYCDVFESVIGVVDSEDTAIEWQLQKESTETEWRMYMTYTVNEL